MKKIMIAAGGTGGHIFPGLAVAQALLQQQIQVVWIGTEQGMENKLIPAQNIALKTLPIQGLRGKGWRRLLKAPQQILLAVYAARKVIQQEKPDLVLGMGGYVSGPMGVAARLSGVPLIIHEQNAIAGLTNKLLARIANAVCESFPNTFKPAAKIIYSGNPVRENIRAAALKEKAAKSPIHILVLGGSQGARAINQIIPEVIARFSAEKILVWHQTGLADLDSVAAAYQDLRVTPYRVNAFIEDMAAAYQWADLVICRAGATTVAELTTMNLPAIFIPLPHAVDDHQTANAQQRVQQQAAIILPQSELSCENLFNQLEKLCFPPQHLQQMRVRAAAIGSIDAVANVVKVCRSVMKSE